MLTRSANTTNPYPFGALALAGDPLGSELLVNTTTVSSQFSPGVAVDADGDFVVVWESDGQDGDGFGNVCDADLDNNGVFDNTDFVQMRSVFYSGNADADLNGDGSVNVADMAILKSLFNQPPGPSGIVPPMDTPIPVIP